MEMMLQVVVNEDMGIMIEVVMEENVENGFQ